MHDKQVRTTFGLLLASFFCFFSLAQSPSSVPPANPPVAYETATLPKDRVQAWEMLRAATGLRDDTLQPWYLHASYKTYDASGKPKDEGTMEYVWAGPRKWHESFTESGLTWQRWQTEQGSFGAPGQAVRLSYPASLIVGQIRDPLGLKFYNRRGDPETLVNNKLGNVDLSCFRDFTYAALPSVGAHSQGTSHDLYCTYPSKPILVFAQANYTVLYKRTGVYDHRLAPLEIHVRDGRDPVIDIDVDALRAPSAAELASLAPPPDAASRTDIDEDGYSVSPRDHTVKKVPPSYPSGAKMRRSEGIVRLAISIAKDGRTRVTDVLHSPDPELTDAAKKAVEQWVYQPYLKNGQPAKVETQVDIYFVLAR